MKDISALIKAEIQKYAGKIEPKEVGTVISYGDGIARVYGLKNAMLGELVTFSNGIYGMVMNLDETDVGVALLNRGAEIKEGDSVHSTGDIVKTRVGDALLGRVVSPLGAPIDGEGPLGETSFRAIERIAPGVMERKSVDTPLETGIKAIDSMIPIGRGQRELIIGDRQTGKTSIALDAILNQKGKNVKCVYVAIGQKNSSVRMLHGRLREAGALSYTTIVHAGASDPAPELYIAPFAGMAIAEEWMEKGDDVLIVLDDLSKHAVAYRALSLLLRRSPGREAYPGDIFYLHSRLLERACRLSDERGGGSITALPIVETQAGDISAYIPTNVISITDGQIFLTADYFASGQRPAIDSGFSVSRVGSNAQYKAMKQVSSSLKIDLATYRENLSFAQFGSDLDQDTKRILAHGSRGMEMLKQKNFSPLSFEEEVVELYAYQKGRLDDVPEKEIGRFLEALRTYFHDRHQAILDKIRAEKVLTDKTKDELDEAISDMKGLWFDGR